MIYSVDASSDPWCRFPGEAQGWCVYYFHGKPQWLTAMDSSEPSGTLFPADLLSLPLQLWLKTPSSKSWLDFFRCQKREVETEWTLGRHN